MTFLAPESKYKKENSNPILGNLFFWWLVWWLRKSAIFFIVWGLCLVIWVIPGGLTCLDWHHLVLSRTFKSKSSLSCQSDRSRPSIVVVVVYLSVGVYLFLFNDVIWVKKFQSAELKYNLKLSQNCTFKNKSSLSCQSDRSRPSIVVVVVYLSLGVYLSIMSLGLWSFHLQDQCRTKYFGYFKSNLL